MTAAMAKPGIGVVVDNYKGVKIYNNGSLYGRSYGKNFAKDGYYYGQKWQCVEFVKRFYAKAKYHKMPDVWGHAKDYFNPKLADGKLNRARGLLQFKNGSASKPKSDDILVFNDTRFGHIAIVSRVGTDYVEVVQQNIYKTPRERYTLVERKGRFFIIAPKAPAGWLRKTKLKTSLYKQIKKSKVPVKNPVKMPVEIKQPQTATKDASR
jgi:surface antigen